MKLRSIAKLLGGLLTLVIVVLVSIPFFISAEYLKGQLVAQVKNTTGRDLVIKGNASLTLFPNIAVEVEDVTLSNPAGFTSPYFVTVKKLQTGAALKPLLNKELRITGIAVEGATLNLEENKAGAKNWEFTVAKAKEETKENLREEKAKGSPLNQFAVGDVTLKDSTVNYLKAGEKPLVAKEINLTVRGADGHGALKVDGGVHYQGAPVNMHLTVNALLDALEGKPTATKFELSLPDASITFNGKASMKETPNADGALSINSPNLPKLLAWATGKPAASGLPKQIDLKSTLALKGTQAVTLSDLSLSADELKAEGKLALNLAGAVPAVQGALSLGKVDLDALSTKSATATATASGKAAKPSAPSEHVTEGWSDAAIDMSGLRAANANLELKIAALHASNLDISDVAATIALSGGNLKLNLANASLYGGSAKGTVGVDGSGAGVGVTSNLAFTDIKIEPLMTALSGRSRLEGTGNVTLAVNGRGASERAIVSSLSGKGAIRLNDGAIKGINIASFMRSAKKGLLFSERTTEKTDFTEMVASFDIAQGVLSNKDLSMKSPILRIAGSGTASLPSRSLNYRLVPTLVGTLEGQGGKEASGLAVPLLITGPWSNPTVTPDLKGIIEEGLKDPKAFKQNLKDLKGTLKQFNSPKDIGRALLGGGAATEQPAAPAPAAGTQASPAPQPQPDPVQQGVGILLDSLQKKK